VREQASLTHEGELAFDRVFGVRCALLRAGRDSVSAGFRKSYKTDLPLCDLHKDVGSKLKCPVFVANEMSGLG